MNDPITPRLKERVGAFIIRERICENAAGFYELLLFKDGNCKNSSLQIPGGGIEPDESVEAALHREIYEESGLVNLKIIRKLGIVERCWLDTRATSRRHYFLLEASPTTPDRWEHIVHGDGLDAGFCFTYFWHRPTLDFVLEGGCRTFLHPHFIPELYW